MKKKELIETIEEAITKYLIDYPLKIKKEEIVGNEDIDGYAHLIARSTVSLLELLILRMEVEEG